MPDPASFSTLPFFQIAAAALTLLGGVWMFLQAKKDTRTVPEPKPMPEGVQMFFQGPLVTAMQCLQRVADSTQRLQEKAAIRNDSLRDVVHGQNNIQQILNALVEGERKARDELAKQTATHADLMGRLEHRIEDIARELELRRKDRERGLGH